jgi:hypothetical protein
MESAARPQRLECGGHRVLLDHLTGDDGSGRQRHLVVTQQHRPGLAGIAHLDGAQVRGADVYSDDVWGHALAPLYRGRKSWG